MVVSGQYMVSTGPTLALRSRASFVGYTTLWTPLSMPHSPSSQPPEASNIPQKALPEIYQSQQQTPSGNTDPSREYENRRSGIPTQASRPSGVHLFLNPVDPAEKRQKEGKPPLPKAKGAIEDNRNSSGASLVSSPAESPAWSTVSPAAIATQRHNSWHHNSSIQLERSLRDASYDATGPQNSMPWISSIPRSVIAGFSTSGDASPHHDAHARHLPPANPKTINLLTESMTTPSVQDLPYQKTARSLSMQDSSLSREQGLLGRSETRSDGVESTASMNNSARALIQAEQGILGIPVDIQAASRSADEKRRRNAGASARFRARRKEKEQASTRELDDLKQQIRDLTEDSEFYRRERNYLANLVYHSPERERHFPRPISPRHHRPHPSSSGATVQDGTSPGSETRSPYQEAAQYSIQQLQPASRLNSKVHHANELILDGRQGIKRPRSEEYSTAAPEASSSAMPLEAPYQLPPLASGGSGRAHAPRRGSSEQHLNRYSVGSPPQASGDIYAQASNLMSMSDDPLPRNPWSSRRHR